MYRHVEMLRDDMSILMTEPLEARRQVTEATSITRNIDGRFHMLESEMSGVWKKLQEEATRPRSGKGNQGQTRVQVCQARIGKQYNALCLKVSLNGSSPSATFSRRLTSGCLFLPLHSCGLWRRVQST